MSLEADYHMSSIKPKNQIRLTSSPRSFCLSGGKVRLHRLLRGARIHKYLEIMKIINHPPDPAVEDARHFVETAFHAVDWDNFKGEIQGLEFHGMLAPDIMRDVQKFLHGTLRRLFWELELSPVEYVKAREMLEAVCEVVDFIDAAFGPGYLENLFSGRF
jgi:hypothetical protein